MKDVKKLLEKRAEMKSKKPLFLRQNSGKIKEAKGKYRKPKGYQSKLRLKIKGKGILPSQGYRSPKEVRGLSKEGFSEVIVEKLSDLEKINSKEQVAIIGSKVGLKKRIQLLEKAKELKLNIKHEKDLETLKKSFETLKKTREEKNKSRKIASSKKESKKESKEVESKEKKDDSLKSEDKTDEKKEIKKEQEKILIDKNKAI